MTGRVLVAVLTLVGVVLAACGGETNPATNVTHNSAQLNATAACNADLSGEYRWQTRQGAGNWANVGADVSFDCPPDQDPNTSGYQWGRDPVPITTQATGLTPSSTYDFRLQATLSNGAVIHTDSNGGTNGNNYDAFTTLSSPSSGCSTSTPNVEGGPAPWGGCFPNAATTGVPAGTNLTPYTGPNVITTNGTVIDSKTVNGGLTIRAANVVIRNSLVNGSVWIDSFPSSHSFTITDSKVDAGPVDAVNNDGASAIGKSNFVATRVETVRGIRGVWCEYNCTVQDSFVHGQDPDEGGHAHQSGIRMGDGSTIRRNSIRCDAPHIAPDAGCSADLTGYGDFAPIRNNRIEKNLFLATPGGTCAYGGSSGDDGSKPFGNQAANIVFQDNVFQRNGPFGATGKCGYWFPITDFDSTRPGNQWINNRWDDGAVVPPAN